MPFKIRAGIRRFVYSSVFRALLPPILLIILIAAAASSNYGKPTRFENVGPRVRYFHFADPTSPVNFDVLRISRREALISVRPVLGDGFIGGLEPVSKQALSTNKGSFYPIAAINGDFYHAGGMPLGIMVSDREILTAPV